MSASALIASILSVFIFAWASIALLKSFINHDCMACFLGAVSCGGEVFRVMRMLFNAVNGGAL